jgi:hypothetical protein
MLPDAFPEKSAPARRSFAGLKAREVCNYGNIGVKYRHIRLLDGRAADVGYGATHNCAWLSFSTCQSGKGGEHLICSIRQATQAIQSRTRAG